VIAGCGAQAIWFGREQGSATLLGAQAAVVATEERSDTPSHGAEVLRLASSSGIKALAYADGITEWSTLARCRILLMGATVLLDSAAADFDIALTRELTAMLSECANAMAERARLKSRLAEVGLVAESTPMLQLFRLVTRLAQLSEVPVLIAGESGTGKELLARALHRFDPRRHGGPFIAVNCGAISPGLAESELFGHTRGSFTGAERGRKGLIRAASGGVLFLDEIGEMSLELQAKMLRALQDGQITSVGDETAIRADARVIAATNRDLPSMIAEGRFRADLFHRLNVVPVRVVPLRERPQDIEPLVRHFVAKYKGLTLAPCDIGQEFLDALSRLELPGNVRQLENIVRQTLVHKCDAAPLGLRDLPPEVWRELARRGPSGDAGSGGGEPAAERAALFDILSSHGWNLSESLGDCERQMIQAALLRAKGNQTKAAHLLGITPRSIYNKLRRYHS
jgi:transcriptional regulator with PAS, ATPase and Fis domain